MFTGIIEEIGTVVKRSGSDLTVKASKVLGDLKQGDSVAVNGACMTASVIGRDSFSAQVSPESLARTTLGSLSVGAPVNLERAMAAGDRFGGHFVQGHVDGVGRVVSVRPQGEFALWRFDAPPEVARYIVPKGSITVDGISLTVIEPEGSTFGVAVIPTTTEHTVLKFRQPGDAVNLEADVIGRHIYHYVNSESKEGLSMDFLARNGFV